LKVVVFTFLFALLKAQHVLPDIHVDVVTVIPELDGGRLYRRIGHFDYFGALTSLRAIRTRPLD
jgi:hypothetical protein